MVLLQVSTSDEKEMTQVEREQGFVTRRDFLKKTAIIGAGVASAGALGACSAKQVVADPSTVKWDKETDVVVIGAGTGMAAAVTAASAGAKVILLEKSTVTGGSTALSGGMVWIPNSKIAQKNGDTKEKAWDILKKIQLGYGDDEQSQAFLDNGQATLDLLAEKCGFEWDQVPEWSQGREYHPEWSGMKTGRSIWVKTGSYRSGDKTNTNLAGGPRLGTVLRNGCDSLGVEVLVETSGKKLVTRLNADGIFEILGVVAQNAQGEIKIKANKGVVLSTGGFEWNEELKAKYLKGPTPYMISVPQSTGDGLLMAMSVGADLRLMNRAWGMPCYKLDSETKKKAGKMADFALELNRHNPGTIMVDRHGRRFCNESSDYDSIWASFFNRDNFGDNSYSTDPCYLIADANAVKKFGIGVQGKAEINPAAVQANTIAELATKLNIPAENLVATVERFNTYAKQLQDPDYHRGESYYDQAYHTSGPEQVGPANALGALETGPYYALEAANGTIGTNGGPRLNKNAQVLNTDGNVIPRLYACGNCAGVGAPGGSYGGAGGTIGPGIVFGYLAGKHLASLQAWA